MYTTTNLLSIVLRIYVPGLVANLPYRNRRTRYRHAGHSRKDVREHFPWSVEVVGPDGRIGFDFEVSDDTEPERGVSS